MSGEKEKDKEMYHQGTAKEILLNDILQQILIKNEVKNRLEWKVYISKER
jgi:hypothetical protein